MGTRKDFLNLRDTQYAPKGDTGFHSEHGLDATDSERRAFLFACSGALASAAVQISTAATAQPSTAMTGRSSAQTLVKYANSILSDEQGLVFKASAIKPLTNYLFHYPYIATPCLLLNLGRDVGGAGKSKSIVAFSAICSHKLAYPAREVSFIRFQAKASSHSEAERIHCCADHSVYDPAQGAKVVTGPAPVALAAVLLEYDAKSDSLRAAGVSGVNQFDAFFAKYDFKLNLEFGNRSRSAVGGTTRLQELTQFCRNVAQC